MYDLESIWRQYGNSDSTNHKIVVCQSINVIRSIQNVCVCDSIFDAIVRCMMNHWMNQPKKRWLLLFMQGNEPFESSQFNQNDIIKRAPAHWNWMQERMERRLYQK